MRFLLLFLFPILAFGVDYSLATDYSFIHRNQRVFTDGYFVAVGGADIDKRSYRNSDLHYSEGGAALFVNAYPAKDHALSFGFGYGQMRLDFAENPFFKQKHFNEGVVSLAYITTAIEQWRWVVDVGIHANLDHLNLGNNAFYAGKVWGRLAYKKPLGIHIGIVGQTGVKSTYLFPILGFDWFFHKKWKINAIFPLDFSLHYFFAKNWSSALSYRSFGGWYRSFRRVGKLEMNPESMLSVHANGLDFGIYLNTKHFSAGLFAGANFGGWFLIRNRHGAKPIYFHFDTKAYGGAKASLEF
ncbi:MAG: hypothetical protein KDK60_01780 [Chlamydiia bacterium]|nr:hypothetical protein [Chlamydiia bacterium]